MIKLLKSYQNELLSVDGKLFQIKIEMIPFHQIDKMIKHKLLAEYLADKKAQMGMELMGIPEQKKLEQMAICRYGGMDDKPDFDQKKRNHEWFNCGKRGKCKGEGLVCKSIKTELGSISPRQIQYLQFAVKGWTDKRIAKNMGVAHTTICSYRTHCQKVLGLENKVALVAWAKDKNIG